MNQLSPAVRKPVGSQATLQAGPITASIFPVDVKLHTHTVREKSCSTQLQSIFPLVYQILAEKKEEKKMGPIAAFSSHARSRSFPARR